MTPAEFAGYLSRLRPLLRRAGRRRRRGHPAVQRPRRRVRGDHRPRAAGSPTPSSSRPAGATCRPFRSSPPALGPGSSQLTSADVPLRRPACPDGGVLVVGASASGVQLADELAGAGRGWCSPWARTPGCPAGTAAGHPVVAGRVGSFDRASTRCPTPAAGGAVAAARRHRGRPRRRPARRCRTAAFGSPAGCAGARRHGTAGSPTTWRDTVGAAQTAGCAPARPRSTRSRPHAGLGAGAADPPPVIEMPAGPSRSTCGARYRRCRLGDRLPARVSRGCTCRSSTAAATSGHRRRRHAGARAVRRRHAVPVPAQLDVPRRRPARRRHVAEPRSPPTERLRRARVHAMAAAERPPGTSSWSARASPVRRPRCCWPGPGLRVLCLDRTGTAPTRCPPTR